MDVLIRVVIDVVHMQDGAARQEHRIAVAIDGLAIDVPVGDADEPFLLPVWQDRPTFEFVAEVVRMGINAQNLKVDGKR